VTVGNSDGDNDVAVGDGDACMLWLDQPPAFCLKGPLMTFIIPNVNGCMIF